EKLRVGGLLDNLARGVDVALANEDRVLVHAVDLDGDTLGPRPKCPGAADRQARVEEQRAAGSGPRLRELLRRQNAEREPGVDEVRRQLVGGTDAALAQFVESGPADIGKSLVDGREYASTEQVGGVDRMAGRAKIVGEPAHAGRQSLCMVEQHNFD